jgi:hypothetical protein
MSDLFDRFNGAPAAALVGHVADSGDTWFPTSGTNLNLNGTGGVYPNTITGRFWIAMSTATPPGADYATSFVVGADLVADGFAHIAGGPIVRGGSPDHTSDSGQFGYILQLGAATVQFAVIAANTASNLGSAVALNTALAANDVITLAAAGSSPVVLSAYQNGLLLGTYSDASGGKLTAAGSAGLEIFASAPVSQDICRCLWSGAIGGPSGSISPTSATVATGGTQLFTATGGLTNETLNWSSSHGSMSPSSGSTSTYTAPGTGTSDLATWTSADLPTHTVSASIIVPGIVVKSSGGGRAKPRMALIRKPMLDFPLPTQGNP